MLFYEFLLYSKVTQSFTHTHTILFLTSSTIMFHHKCLDTVPCAAEQDLMAYPLQMQQSAPINPRLPDQHFNFYITSFLPF